MGVHEVVPVGDLWLEDYGRSLEWKRDRKIDGDSEDDVSDENGDLACTACEAESERWFKE